MTSDNTPVSNFEIDFDEIPVGWVLSTIGDIAKVTAGGTPTASDESNFSDEGYPWITPADLSNFSAIYIERGRRSLSEKGLRTSSAKMLPKGTVLMSSRAPIGYVAIAANPISTNQGFKNFICHDGISPEYVYYWIKFLNPYLEEMGSGSTFAEISGSRAKKIPIKYPPLPEQHRIVAKVEELFKEVDAAHDRLKQVPAILKHFRQAVLAAACSGMLTEEWREEHLKIGGNGCDLKNILEERQRKWNINNKSKRYHEPLSIENNDLPELPILWCHASIDQIASTEPHSIQSGPFGSNLLHSEFKNEGILAIGIDNVLEGTFSLGKQHRISQQKYEELKKYSARPLDVLVTVMATIGRCCVVPKDLENAIITKHVYRITVDKEIINPFFLLFTLMGDTSVGNYIQSQIRGQTRPGINGEILKRTPIPLPPIEEQHEIVRRVEFLFALADEIEHKVVAATKRTDGLRQAILTKAFRGELVPTEVELGRTGS